MTYATLYDIELFAGRLEAEKIAARYVAVQRVKMERALAKIDERKQEADDGKD